MNGFTDIVNGFDINAIQELQDEADIIYGHEGYIYSLPSTEDKIDVTSQSDLDSIQLGLTPLEGDNLANDTDALNAINAVTGITNWFFPSGHTFRLLDIVPGSHVNTIWGKGTLRQVWTASGAKTATINLRTTPTTHLLIDGITMIPDGTGYSLEEDGIYGVLSVGRTQTDPVQNVEIRNCSFIGQNDIAGNAISVFGRSENGGSKHFNIHNNIFTDIGRCAIELVQRSDTPAAENDGIEDVNIYENDFSTKNMTNTNLWRCAVSFSQVRQACVIHNNTFDTCAWDIEINQGDKITARNNTSEGCFKYFMSYGTAGLHGNDDFPVGVNYVHNNHWGGGNGNYHIYGGSLGKVYENYIAGALFSDLSNDKPEWGAGIGEVYNNTFVKDVTLSNQGANSVIMIADTDVGSDFDFHDNEIYAINSGSYLINATSLTATATITNIEGYRTTSDSNCCTTANATVSNVNYTPSYSGDIPTNRPGAGRII